MKEQKIFVTLLARGYMRKYLNGKNEITVELQEGTSVKEALKIAGITPEQCPGYAFCAIKGSRVSQDHILMDQDKISVFSASHGG